MTEYIHKSSENIHETGLKSRIRSLSRQELVAFCSFAGLHGANFYTMRDKLVYQYRGFRRWEEEGIDQMIHKFAPDYDGALEDYYNRLEEKKRFVRFMESEGGMSSTSCYQRFKTFNFKKWELMGLNGLLNLFLKTQINKEE